jgi:hypothetical protein
MREITALHYLLFESDLTMRKIPCHVYASPPDLLNLRSRYGWHTYTLDVDDLFGWAGNMGGRDCGSEFLIQLITMSGLNMIVSSLIYLVK